ncbi:MAG: hypothetical protein IPP94_10585 [Ignavibacteria bacterium]|nr:hypothetical protein [Ignavibacteria bacterium]
MKQISVVIAIMTMWLLSFLAMSAVGQNVGVPSRVSSMAYSSTGLVNGVDAIGINPALITLPKGQRVSIALLPFSLNAGTDFFSYETYQKYFTGVPGSVAERDPYYMNTAEKTELLDMFNGRTGTIRASMSYTLAAVSVSTPAGSFAIGIRDRIATNAVIPRSLAEFFLFGNTPGTTFDFRETSISSSWTRDYSFTYAQRIQFSRKQSPALSFGATIKYVEGYGYFGLDQFNSTFRTDPDSFVVSGRAQAHALYAGTDWMAQSDIFKFQLFPTPAGSGYGIDLGVMAELSTAFRVGLSFTDVGNINWNRNTREVTADEAIEVSDLGSYQQLDEITRRLNGKEHAISSFSTPLPTAITASAAYSFSRFLGVNRPMHLALSVREGLNSAPGNSTIPHVGIGAEWEAVPSIPIRLGVAAGGGLSPMLAAGIGLKMDSFTLDIGTNSLDSYVSSNHAALSVAISGRLDF